MWVCLPVAAARPPSPLLHRSALPLSLPPPPHSLLLPPVRDPHSTSHPLDPFSIDNQSARQFVTPLLVIFPSQPLFCPSNLISPLLRSLGVDFSLCSNLPLSLCVALQVVGVHLRCLFLPCCPRVPVTVSGTLPCPVHCIPPPPYPWPPAISDATVTHCMAQKQQRLRGARGEGEQEHEGVARRSSQQQSVAVFNKAHSDFTSAP